MLCIHPFEAKKIDPMAGAAEFKLAVGYYAPYIQVFDIMESTEGSGYLFVDQKQSDASYHDKAGISALSAMKIKSKKLEKHLLL